MLICLKCIGDEALRKRAKAEAVKVKCSYCEGKRLGLPLKALAEIVDEPLRSFCGIGEFYPVFHGDSDKPDYSQEGESLSFLLQEELEIDCEPAEDLIPLLIDLDPSSPYDGDAPFYCEDNNYHRRGISPWEFSNSWRDFSKRIKHQRRFFDENAAEKLAEILGRPKSTKASDLPIFELGPGSKIESIFRARRVNSDADALHYKKNLAAELGPPPHDVATAGRMNAAGISVFYGALSEDTAIAEVRPYVGSVVMVGEFELNRALRVLDLSQIGIGFTGSIFHPDYENKASRLRFLQGFHSLIARPIQPHEESLEYVPTQAVAEYVANVLKLDGILFGSAQLGAVPEDEGESSHYVRIQELTVEELGQHNIVLFGDAAVVDISDEENNLDSDSPASLTFKTGSDRAVRVNSVQYKHEHYYVHDPMDDEGPIVSFGDF